MAAERLNKIGKDSTIIQRTSSSNRLTDDGSGSLHGAEEIPDLPPTPDGNGTLAPPSPHWSKKRDSGAVFLQSLTAALKQTPAPSLVPSGASASACTVHEVPAKLGPVPGHRRSVVGYNALQHVDERRANTTQEGVGVKPLPGNHKAAGSGSGSDHSEDVIITLNDSKFDNDNSAHQVLLPKLFTRHPNTTL